MNLTASRAGNTVTVAWDLPSTGPAPASYTLHVRDAFTLDLPLTTRIVSGSVPAGRYVLSVSALNACGAGPASAPQTVVVP